MKTINLEIGEFAAQVAVHRQYLVSVQGCSGGFFMMAMQPGNDDAPVLQVQTRRGQVKRYRSIDSAMKDLRRWGYNERVEVNTRWLSQVDGWPELKEVEYLDTGDEVMNQGGK